MTAVIWVRQVIEKYAKFGLSTELSESPSEQRASNQRSLSQSISVGNTLTFMNQLINQTFVFQSPIPPT